MPKRIFEGKVISNKMDKTAVVRVDRKVKHPIYKKYIVKSAKYLAHDETNSAEIGDLVKIIENKPISKRKAWLIVDQNSTKQKQQQA